MNAVTVEKRATPKEDAMPANDDSRDDARRSDQLPGLRADVRHLQADVTELKGDLKTEIRAVNQRVDSLSNKVDALRDKVDEKYGELRDKLDAKVTGLIQRMDGFNQVVTAQFTDVRKDIASVSDKIGSAKLWTVLLVFSVAVQLLYVIAHALKWL